MTHTALLTPASADITRAAPPTLQRACSCGAAKGVEGQCPACAAKARLGVQPKLTVNRPGDRYEQEADRVADRVVAAGPPSGVPGTVPTFQRKMVEEENELQAKPAGVRRMDQDEDELQMKAAGPAPASPAVTQAAAAVSGGGQPLSRAERGYFEPRLGRDLSSVRLHDDARAGSAAHGINARAYTHRNHIAFAPGTHDFASTEGRRLIAHELVHTAQQFPEPPIRRFADPEAKTPGPVPSSNLSITAFTGDPYDSSQEKAKGVAEKRFKSGEANLIFPIMQIEDVGQTLAMIALRLNNEPAQREDGTLDALILPPDHPGIVSRLDIIGHGKAGTKTSEAFYGFGATAYKTSEIANLHHNGLDFSRFMQSGGTLTLEGCSTAKGAEGRLYMMQIGGIFFGRKSGKIKANTTESFEFAGEMMGGSQIEFSWPSDFRDLEKTENEALLSGSWRGAGLTVRLVIDAAGVVTGTYGQTGTLSGSFDGTQIDYRWTDSSMGSGLGYWKWNRANGKLEGRYGTGASVSNGGEWNLTKR